MLPLNTPFWGLPCGTPRYWRLRVEKDFVKPKYYIGQTVVHQFKIFQKQFRQQFFKLQKERNHGVI